MHIRFLKGRIYGPRSCWDARQGVYSLSWRIGLCLLTRDAQVGLLPADNKDQVPFAYKMYARHDEVGWEQSCAFRNTFSITVQVDFLGVWCPPFHQHFWLSTPAHHLVHSQGHCKLRWSSPP